VPGPVKAATGAVGAVVSNVAKTAGAVGEDELKNDLLKAKNKGSNMLYDTFSNNKESSNLTTQNTEAKPKENLSIGNNTSNANTNNTKPLTLSNEPRDNQNISQNTNTNTDQTVVNNTTSFKDGNNKDFVDLPTNHSKSLSPKTYAEEAQDKKNEADAKIVMQNSSLGEVSIDLANQKDSSSQGMAIKDELPSSQVSTNDVALNSSQPNAQNLDNLSDAKNSALQDAGSNYAHKTSAPESSSIPEIKTESLLEENLSKERPKVVTKVVEKENKSNQQVEKEAERMKKLQE